LKRYEKMASLFFLGISIFCKKKTREIKEREIKEAAAIIMHRTN